jgi:hypothetical protein
MASKTSKGAEAYFARYKTSKTWETNRKRKLERALKEQPNNENIKLALKNIHYRRKTPTSPYWSASMIKTAKMYKQWVGFFDKMIFHPDPKVHQLALSKPSIRQPQKVAAAGPKQPGMFSIEARLQGTR